jgi:hypothetical protein
MVVSNLRTDGRARRARQVGVVTLADRSTPSVKWGKDSTCVHWLWAAEIGRSTSSDAATVLVNCAFSVLFAKKAYPTSLRANRRGRLATILQVATAI